MTGTNAAQGFSLVCTLSSASVQHAPYRIHNACSSHVVCIRQKDASEFLKDREYLKIMPSRAALPFAWDDAVSTHKLAVLLLPRGMHLTYTCV
jgi:hypothetical protein